MGHITRRQSINQYPFLRHDKMQANNSKQKGNTGSKKKSRSRKQARELSLINYVFLYNMRVRKLESDNCVEC